MGSLLDGLRGNLHLLLPGGIGFILGFVCHWWFFGRLDPVLQKQLELLVRDRATAKRLVVGIKKRHKRRSLRWCQEKALNDLKRDRRN